MDEPEPIVQVILNIGTEGGLSQAEADALIAELRAQVSGKMAGSVDVISPKSTDESLSKSEPMITLAVAVLQYVVPKLIEVVYEMIKERRNNRVKAFAKVGGEEIVMDSQTSPIEFKEIQNRVQAANATEEVHDRRYALLIGTTSYQDTRLNQLASPEVDIKALADTLRDPAIGAYDDVNLLLNQSSSAILQAVEQFFNRKASTDLLLLYFSGHGVRGERGKLYLAAENTNLELLNSTALSSSFIENAMDNSQSERQILILDCCYSGSFLNRTKAATVGDRFDATSAFEGNGFGRIVLTATDKTQLAWEGQKITGQVQKSVFTEHLIEGLKTGEADRDRDGWIGLYELYNYVHDRMVKTTRDQTPEMNAFNMKGSIFLARNPRPKPMELPAELQSLLNSPYADVRANAVGKLSELFDGSQYGLALAARKALEKLAMDDSRTVSQAASKALGLIPAEAAEKSPEKAFPQPTTEEPDTIPVPWWTKIKPPPGTRSGGTKSGPTPIENSSPPANTYPFASSLPNPQQPIRQVNTDYRAVQNAATAPAGSVDRLRQPDNLALVAGLLSLLLFFLPVSLWGFLVGLRAIKKNPRSYRALTGFGLSCMALAIQFVLVLFLI